MRSPADPLVCIIGAGPYGLAIAAHLRFSDIDFRIFGSPMHRWSYQMPENMLLKSEGCASSLPDPAGYHTLAKYCSDQGLSFSNYITPVSREVFARYAISFQQKLVPHVENVTVTSLSKSPNGFQLKLSTGETLATHRVIVATGLDYMTYIPEQLGKLPVELRSHSADYHDLSGFKGKEIAVIGGGQSALETAALLREEGAFVNLLVRGPSLKWNRVPSKAHRTLYERWRFPRTRLGDGLKLWAYDNVPELFHRLPLQVRVATVKATLGPAGAWWLKDRVEGRLPILLGCHMRAAEIRAGRAALQVANQNGALSELIVDHVIAATGYQFKTKNLPFLSEHLKAQLRSEEQSPVLTSNFESTVPGLYFTSLGSANAFGPVMRFLAGANCTARRISAHIARSHRLPIRRPAKPEKCPEF